MPIKVKTCPKCGSDELRALYEQIAEYFSIEIQVHEDAERYYGDIEREFEDHEINDDTLIHIECNECGARWEDTWTFSKDALSPESKIKK